jgi:hypothetical protein
MHRISSLSEHVNSVHEVNAVNSVHEANAVNSVHEANAVNSVRKMSAVPGGEAVYIFIFICNRP